MQSLLPPSSTRAEAAIAASGASIGDLPLTIADVWDPARCPAPLLPWLAWALSVDVWLPGWPEDIKRAVIGASIEVQRRKGTVGSVRRALAAAGLGQSQLIEHFSALRHDGSHLYDGRRNHQRSDHWAEYRIALERPLSIAQAAQVREILARTAPARCALREMRFTQVAHTHDGSIRHDGVYTHGVV